MAKELMLTQTDLNEEGIKTQLTQNDLLEVIVEEKIQTIDREIEGVQEGAKNFASRINRATREIATEAFAKEVKRLKIPFTAEELQKKIEEHDFYYNIEGEDRYDSSKYIQTLNVYGGRRGRKNEERINMSSADSFRMLKEKVKMSFSTLKRTEHKGYKEETTYKFTVEVDTKKTPLQKIYEEVDQHNENVKVIFAKYENMNLDKEAILKEVRTTFNKQLIISGAPKLRQKVKDTFLIELQ